MDSIQIHDWHDMNQFGINVLTGESCAFGMRLLCDLNEDGVVLINDYFGINGAFNANWNSEVDGKLAIASVMLPRELLMPLARFALFRRGALAIAQSPANTLLPGAIVGIFSAERLAEYDAHGGTNFSIQRNPRGTGPGIGSRNTHAMSGRTE